MYRLSTAAALAFSLAVHAVPAFAEPMSEAFPQLVGGMDPAYAADTGKLNLLHGKLALDGGMIELDLPDRFYALGPKDAQYVLEKLWGNPPDDTVLAMVFPSGKTPLEAAWGLTVLFDGMGYVSDEDAGSYDFDALLADMQSDQIESNKWRVQNGYAEINLLGWAEPPHYDATERKLYWAKRLKFADSDADTLNYDIRVLGRKGVVVAGFVAGMDALPEVKAAARDVLNMISFTEGNRYADYQPGVDTVAELGIGGLIDGNSLAQTGLLVLLLAFLKKGGFILILAPFSWLWTKIRGREDDDAA